MPSHTRCSSSYMMKLEDISLGGAQEVITDFDIDINYVCFHFKAKVSVSQEKRWILNGISDNFPNSVLLFFCALRD